MLAKKYSDEKIEISDYYLYKESIKDIIGYRYDAESKCWYVPLCKENALLLQMLGAELDDELKMLTVSESYQVNKKEQVPFVKMPIKAKPYVHQIQAFNMAMQLFGVVD